MHLSDEEMMKLFSAYGDSSKSISEHRGGLHFNGAIYQRSSYYDIPIPPEIERDDVKLPEWENVEGRVRLQRNIY